MFTVISLAAMLRETAIPHDFHWNVLTGAVSANNTFNNTTPKPTNYADANNSIVCGRSHRPLVPCAGLEPRQPTHNLEMTNLVHSHPYLQTSTECSFSLNSSGVVAQREWATDYSSLIFKDCILVLTLKQPWENLEKFSLSWLGRSFRISMAPTVQQLLVPPGFFFVYGWWRNDRRKRRATPTLVITCPPTAWQPHPLLCDSHNNLA